MGFSIVGKGENERDALSKEIIREFPGCIIYHFTSIEALLENLSKYKIKYIYLSSDISEIDEEELRWYLEEIENYNNEIVRSMSIA